MGYHQGKLQTWSGTNPRERSVLQLVKPEGQNHLRLLTSDIEFQDLEFTWLGFSLALFHISSLCPYSFLLE